MKKFLALTVSSLAAVTLLTAGCAEQFDTSPYFFAMAADAAFVIPKDIRAEKEKDCYRLYGETRSLLNELDSSLSASNENSYISKFNRAAPGAEVELNKTAYEVLSLAKNIYEKTGGYYNPAVYYNVQAYGFGGAAEKFPSDSSELPHDEVIEKYNLLSASFADLSLEERDGRYFTVKPSASVEIGGVSYSLKLDLGGVGKGYAVDKVNALMDGRGINYGYFSFGESSIAFKKFNGKETDAYTLGLSNPRYAPNRGGYMHTKVKDVCISTSGDNVKYYEIDGVRYCHIIDPATGKPVQTGIMSATVIGGSAAEADALTTALMAMGREKACEFIKTYLKDRKAVFTYDNGEFYEIVTNIPKQELSNIDDRYTLISVAEQ